MKTRASRSWLGLTTLFALSLILLLSAAPPAIAGQTYAIKGAKIVPVRGAVIEKGNIVMRDGVIVAVGANAQIPPDAMVIDGTDLEVYPGLIDASSSFGVPRPRAAQPQQQAAAPAFGFGQQAQAPGRPGVWEPDTTNDPSNYLTPPPRGFTPDLMVGDQLEDGDAAPWRGIGITTVLAAPQTGIVRGQSAVINLNDGRPEEMVVLTPAALHIALTVGGGGGGGGGGYPGTQLGAFAALRQAIADAQWYQARLAQWEQSRGRGVPRPPFSTTSVAFLPALNGKQSVVVSVSRSNDVLKALRIAKENNFRLILETATEAWKVAPQIKASGAAVIVSLNFRPAAGGGGGGGGGFGQQQEPDPDEQRRREQEAQNNAAELTKAGIKVAFSSTGVQNPGEFLASARRAAESMGKDQALAALTINAAEILGVGESLGSIEQGKIANLIVTTASPLDANAQLKYVFVDGVPQKFRSPEPPRGPAGGAGQRPGAPPPARPPGDSAADSRSEVRP